MTDQALTRLIVDLREIAGYADIWAVDLDRKPDVQAKRIGALLGQCDLNLRRAATEIDRLRATQDEAVVSLVGVMTRWRMQQEQRYAAWVSPEDWAAIKATIQALSGQGKAR